MVFVLAMVIVFRVLAPAFQSTLAWIVIAAAASLGWSLTYVLPDAVAAVVMFFERRVSSWALDFGRWI